MQLKSLLIKFPAILLTIISWVLSSRTNIEMPGFAYSDKFVHLICFGALAFCWSLWFSYDKWCEKPLKHLLIVILIVSVYGIIDEIHQSFVPGRFPSVYDWIADTLGAILGGTAGFILAKIIKTKAKE